MRIAWTLRIALPLLMTAVALFGQGVSPQELEQLQKAVAANPQDVNARFDLAVAYSVNGDDARAIPEYEKVLELAPDVYEAHINFGQVLLRAKRPAEAVEQLRRAREQKPTEFRPAYYLGEALFDLMRFADALPAYEAAAQLDPKDAQAELGRARTMARLGQLNESEPHYRQAIALGIDRSFLLELAQLQEGAGHLDAAVRLYAEFPENPGAVERVGVLRLKQGQDREAIAALEAVVKTSPTEANRMALAEAYVRQASLPKAELIARDLAASAPRDFAIRMFYARILRDQKKIPEAAREFESAARVKPDSAEAWSELAGMRILAEQFPEALAALDQVAKLGAENAGHLFFRATTLDRLNQKKEALEYYQRFVDVSRTNPDQEFQARQRVRMLERELGKR